MRCGFYESDITPPLGTTIFGYMDRRKSEGVKDRLHAKAAVFEKDGQYVALLAIDSLSTPKDLPAFVRKRVSEYTPIKGESVLIASTHSHTSGPTCGDLSGFKKGKTFDYEPDLDPELDTKALDMIMLLSADAVILAYQRLEEVELSYAKTNVENISFVREHVTKSGEIKTNAKKEDAVRAVSEPDTDLPVIFVKNKEGKALGLITSFALHHDTVHGSEISSDFSGVVARKMQEKYGNDFVSVFFAGFCGNINGINLYIDDIPQRRGYKEIGEIIFNKLDSAIGNAEKIADDTLSFKHECVKINKRKLDENYLKELEEIMKNPPEIKNLVLDDPNVVKFMRATTVYAIYVDSPIKDFDVPVMVVRIGDVALYGAVGEMFSQFGEKIKAGSPTERNILIEQTVAHGYIPTPELFLPTVYESSYSSAMFEECAGDKIADKAVELAKEIF